MMKTGERITVVKDISSILAAICVATWAAYGSWIKKEERKADLEILYLEQKTTLQSHILTSIKIDEISSSKHDKLFAIYVTLKNSGRENVQVDLNKRSLLIAKVNSVKNKLQYEDVKYLGESRFLGSQQRVLPRIDVGAGESYEVAYLSKIENPGTYLFRFLSKMNSLSVSKNREENFGNSPIEYYTGIDRFLSVE